MPPSGFLLVTDSISKKSPAQADSKDSGSLRSDNDKQRRLDALLKKMKKSGVVRGSDMPAPSAENRPKKAAQSGGFRSKEQRENSDLMQRAIMGKRRHSSEDASGKSQHASDSGEKPTLGRYYPDAERLGDAPDSGAWRISRDIPLDGSCGSTGACVPDGTRYLEALDLSTVSILDPRLGTQDLRREDLAFFDVETTGLMGGAGTYAFLVGLGFFRGDCFIVEQYFMDDFPDEAAMLEAVSGSVRNFKMLVSFNGRSFDAPLLTTRFLMNRLAPPFNMPHLDLLHPARRMWKGRYESCSLGTIEERIFHIERTSDVPGSMIPEIYLDYIQGRNCARIVPVIDHNVQDISSMASLLALYAHALRQPECVEYQHAVTQAGLSRWFADSGSVGISQECLERAVALCRDSDLEYRLSMRLALHYRRQGVWDSAIALWESLAGTAQSHGHFEPFVEMAKYCEHQQKDPIKAVDWTHLAMEFLEALSRNMRQEALDRRDRELGNLAHRLERLEGKLARISRTDDL